MVQKELIFNISDFNAIESLITCSICTDIIEDPIQCVGCENNFCKICINDWKKKSTVCPFKCTNFDLKPSRMTRVLLSKLVLNCPKNCGAKISYDEYNKHCNETCPKIDIKEKYVEVLNKYNALKQEYDTLKKDKETILQRYEYNSQYHQHTLILSLANRIEWGCDICSTQNNRGVPSYYCVQCDFDLCELCKQEEQINK